MEVFITTYILGFSQLFNDFTVFVIQIFFSNPSRRPKMPGDTMPSRGEPNNLPKESELRPWPL